MRFRNFNTSFILLIVLLAIDDVRSGAFADPRQWLMGKILLIPGIIIGLSFHEFGHAFTAYKLGDNTPKNQGRVTVNPMAHIDWVGLAALFFCGFGWGVPVQINPYNFKHRRRDELLVSLSGVFMNLILAIAFAFIAKIFILAVGPETVMADGMIRQIWLMLLYVIQINLVLMVFNLIPVPPLDGFNVLAQIFNFGNTETYWNIYRYGNIILVGLIIFGVTGMIISPCVNTLYTLLTNLII